MALYHPEVGRFLTFDGPFWLQWHITDRCNARCTHCYGEGRRRPDPGPEAIREILGAYQRLLGRLGRAGRLQVSGGEPLVAPRLFDVLEAARAARLPTRILSNGLAVTPALARELLGLGVRIVQVSVEGDRTEHEAVRGPGSWEAAREGCARLSEAGIEVTVACTLHQGNRHAPLTLRRAFAGIARRVHASRLVPVGEGAALAGQLLSARQWAEAMREALAPGPLPEGAPALLTRDPTWVGFHWSGRAAAAHCLAGGCSAGYNGLCVDVDGAVLPCRRLPVPVGNALTDDWHALLTEHPTLRLLRDRDRLEGACGRCGLRWLCGGCRAVAWAVHGTITAPDPQCPWSPIRRHGRLRDYLPRRPAPAQAQAIASP